MNLTSGVASVLEKFEKLVIPNVRKIGSKLKTYYLDPSKLKVEAKTALAQYGDIDFVTDLDKSIEVEIYNLIKAKFPEFGFTVEEHQEWNDNTKDFLCTIDPIDGTKHFLRGVPLFSTQLSLLYQGQPIFGLVFNPLTDQLYSGSALTPTNINGKKVKLSQANKLSEAFIIAGISSHRANWEHDKSWIIAKYTKLVLECQRVRTLGSGGLCAAWVASGGMDAMLNLTCEKPEEIFPGQALINFAGGVTELIDLPEVIGPRYIGGNEVLVKQLKEFLISDKFTGNL